MGASALLLSGVSILTASLEEKIYDDKDAQDAGIIKPVFFMIWAGLADVGMTYLNLTKYGVEFEGNPIIKNLIDETDIQTGLLAPKAFSIIACLGAATTMDYSKRYFDKGKFLLYGAGLASAVGFFTNYYFYWKYCMESRKRGILH